MREAKKRSVQSSECNAKARLAAARGMKTIKHFGQEYPFVNGGQIATASFTVVAKMRNALARKDP